MKKEFPVNWNRLNKKVAYPYEYFKSLEDYELPICTVTKEDYLSKLKNDYPDEEEIERTSKIIQIFKIKNGKILTQLYLKSDVILFVDVFEKFIKVSIEEYKINPL